MILDRLMQALRRAGVARPSTVRELRAQNQKLAEERGMLRWEAGTRERGPLTGNVSRTAREDVRALRDRLRELERSVLHIREGIAVIEVKLDIVEGAIAVLDDRSRHSIADVPDAVPLVPEASPDAPPVPSEMA
jgi:hypothetical protein